MWSIGKAKKDWLTIVVVFHDMAREAPRVLHSLSRNYQLQANELDYRVIASTMVLPRHWNSGHAAGAISSIGASKRRQCLRSLPSTGRSHRCAVNS